LNWSPLHKLFWIVAAIAAVFLFAPGTASAHESYAPPRAAIHAADDLHGSTIRLASAEDALASISAIAPSIEKSEPSDQDSPCTGGCCFGMGCCAATLAANVPPVEPPFGEPLLVTSPTGNGPNARSTSLLEPPNARA
jgi:hypothetical protein